MTMTNIDNHSREMMTNIDKNGKPQKTDKMAIIVSVAHQTVENPYDFPQR